VTKAPPVNTTPLDQRSRELRCQIVRMLQKGGRGHVGSAFSLVEILRVLYDDVLRYDPKHPRFPEAELWKFCKPDGILGGHPEFGKVPGVEASTGSLGHGLPIAVGFALNARYTNAGYRTFVVASDGESNEGSLWEAALCASKHKLSNLTVLVDYNKQQSYSTTYEVLDLEPYADKWRAFGFTVEEVDGHDVNQIRAALKRVPFDSARPSAIICHTIKGKGISFVENNLNWHHKNKVTEEEVKSLLAELEVKA
jgi:transketolase